MMSKRDVIKTDVGMEYQKDILCKELRRLGKKLREQLVALNDLTGTRDIATVKEEREKLNKSFAEMCTVVERLTPLVDEEKAEEMQKMVKVEGENVLNVDVAVKEWLKALEDVDKISVLSDKKCTLSSHRSRTSEDLIPDAKSLYEVMNKHSKLEAQLSLMSDLLMLEDRNMLEAEIATLTRVYENLLRSAEKMQMESACEENQKVDEIIKVATERVEEIKSKAREKVAEIIREEKRSLISTGSRRSRSSKTKHNDMAARTKSCYRDERDTVSEGGREKQRPRGQSTISDSKGGMSGFYHRYDPKERFKLDLVRLQKRVANEISLTESLMDIRGRKILQGRLERLEKLEEEVGSGYLQSSQLFRGAEVKQIEDKIEEQEDKIRRAKEKVVKLMVEEAKNEDTRSRASTMSRMSRTSKLSSIGKGKQQTEGGKELSNEIIQLFNQDLKRVKNQLGLLGDLCQTKDSETLRQEINKAEIILENMRVTVEELSKTILPSRLKYMFELITEKEGEVIEYKRKMIKQLVRSEKEDNVSASSGSTRRTRLTEASDKSYISKKKEEEKGKYEEKTAQVENLREDLGMCKIKLEEEKEMCRKMIESKDDLCLSQGGIKKLEKTFNQMEGVVFRLREQVPSIEIDEMTKLLEVEDNEVFEIKRQAIKQVAVKKKIENGTSNEEAKPENPSFNVAPVVVARRIEGEAARVKNRLDNQMAIIDDLFKSENVELLDQEIQILDKVYDEYVAIIAQLRGKASDEEAERLSIKIDEEDTKVFRKKELVSKLRVWLEGKEARGNDRNIVEEIKERKKEENHLKKKDKDTRVDDSEQKMTMKKDVEDGASSMLRLNELMVQTMKLQAAPKVEIDIFYGDPLEYSYFLENFKDVVENLIDDPKQRLLRLLKYTNGEAKQLIKHCVHEPRETCYATALSLLEKEYGSPLKIACAYHERLKNWPQVKTNDAVGIRSLYRFLVKCLSYQKSGKIDLNSPLTIRNIQLALPNNLQDKWVSRVGRIRKKSAKEATFADFVEFVEDESHCLNDPVYARGAARAEKKEDRKLCAATEMGENGAGVQVEDEAVAVMKCQICASKHDLDDCPTFKEKTAREKKDFLFKAKMCFACYGSNHRAEKCKEKRVCGICEQQHPTGLHGVTFKVSAVKQGGSGMCIVPVRLRHESWQRKELEVYAMLDECSDGTFIDEKLLCHFGEDIQRKTEISVETVNGDKKTMASAIAGLIARGAVELGEEAKYILKLPEVFSQEKLPMNRKDVPAGEDLSKWCYLNKVAQTLPGAKDIPLGLIIGNNCPKALEPMEVIASKDGGPYAKRTRLGWCVSAPAKDEDQRVLACNRIRVVETRLKDNSIGDALQEMWEEDFVEKESEKKALSREDRWFLDKMKESIGFSQGHYVLPLPLRTQKVNSQTEEIDTKVPPKKEKLDAKRTVTTQVNQEKAGEKISIVSEDERVAITKGHQGSTELEDEMNVVLMPKNRNQALRRLKSTKQRMAKDEDFRKEYSAFIDKLLNAGYAKKVPKDRLGERAWYLNHHGVRHPTKKKLRVVYDCSAVVDEVSLNSVLVQGPDFTNSLLGVLVRFRKGLIPIMADIESMYYQVKIPVEHRKFVRFLWWEDGDINTEPVELEMCVHVFGATSSKNCVTFALHQTAKDNMNVFGEEAMKCLLEEFYVDDLLKSIDDVEEAIKLIKNVDGMCAAGGFNLTKFLSTNEKVIDSIPKAKRAEGLKTHQMGNILPEESALGVLWKMQGDRLGFFSSFKADNGTNRGCLSTISRFKDPLGLAAPFLLKGRKILQRLTKNSASWDEQLPNDEAKLWNEWRKEVQSLVTLTIRRCYRSADFGKVVETSLHCFSDASFVGYGVAAYLRMVDDCGKVEVALVMGKSRVCPLKPTTVPRLELTAATVSVKIAALLVEELKIPEMEVHFWIDNKVVLGYILNDKRRFRIYVANRVQLIDAYSKKNQWNYVDTKENPSDYASRGMSPNEKDKVDMWLNGPHFLRSQDDSWRNKQPEIEVVEEDTEVKQEKIVNAIQGTELSVLQVLETRVSSWNRMKRIIVWMLRFSSKEWRKTKKEELSVAEIESAETKLIKLIQAQAYGNEIEKLVKGEQGFKTIKGLEKLNPIIDNKGVVRVGGRLARAEESELFKFPIIIPKKTVATRRLIEWHHKRIEHRGKHSTVSRLRDQGYWVISGGKEVGAVVHRCVRCRWLRGKALGQKMAELPWNRTTAAPPFTYCGADVFGPIQVKEGRKVLKRYGLVFTCFSLRAVHIELLSTLETDSLIQALRRFIARRGAVKEIRSDNGTNFVGAENELKKAMEEIDHKKVGNFLTEQGCDYVIWERNTPSASHMGGVWERQIRTIKSVLCSLLKSSPRRLDEESLRTFLTEAEGIVNSRPLSLENLHDPEMTPLTPNQILTMKTFVASPPPGVFQKEGCYARKRWRVVQHLADAFWSRWKREYLHLQQTRQKWTGERRNLQVNDVVLMKEDGTGRGQWPLGRVMEVHPSYDGMVRSVTLQVRGVQLKRPVHKTVLLVEADELQK